MLPQLLFLAAIGVAFGFACRWVNQEIARVEGQMSRLQRLLQRVSDEPIPRLQLDKTTGIYLPVKF